MMLNFDEDIEVKIIDEEICLDVGEACCGITAFTRDKAAAMAKIFQHFAEHGVLPTYVPDEKQFTKEQIETVRENSKASALSGSGFTNRLFDDHKEGCEYVLMGGKCHCFR